MLQTAGSMDRDATRLDAPSRQRASHNRMGDGRRVNNQKKGRKESCLEESCMGHCDSSPDHALLEMWEDLGSQTARITMDS